MDRNARPSRTISPQTAERRCRLALRQKPNPFPGHSRPHDAYDSRGAGPKLRGQRTSASAQVVHAVEAPEIRQHSIKGSVIESIELLPSKSMKPRGRTSWRGGQLVLRYLQHRGGDVCGDHLHTAAREPQRILAGSAVHLENPGPGCKSHGAPRPHGSAHRRPEGGCRELAVVGARDRIECRDCVGQLMPPFPRRLPASILGPALQPLAAAPLRRDFVHRGGRPRPRCSAKYRPACSSCENGAL